MKYADFEFIRHHAEVNEAAQRDEPAPESIELEPPNLPAALDFSVPATVASRLDVRGLAQPLPILMVRRAVGGLAVGQVLEVICEPGESFATWRAYERVSGCALSADPQTHDGLRLRFRRG